METEGFKVCLSFKWLLDRLVEKLKTAFLGGDGFRVFEIDVREFDKTAIC